MSGAPESDGEKLQRLEHDMDGLFDEIMTSHLRENTAQMEMSPVKKTPWKHRKIKDDASWRRDFKESSVGDFVNETNKKNSNEFNGGDTVDKVSHDNNEDVDEWCLRSEEEGDDDGLDAILQEWAERKQFGNNENMPNESYCGLRQPVEQNERRNSFDSQTICNKVSDCDHLEENKSHLRCFCTVLGWAMCLGALLIMGLGALASIDTGFDAARSPPTTLLMEKIRSVRNAIQPRFVIEEWCDFDLNFAPDLFRTISNSSFIHRKHNERPRQRLSIKIRLNNEVAPMEGIQCVDPEVFTNDLFSKTKSKICNFISKLIGLFKRNKT